MNIAFHNQACITIVLPADAFPTEKFAAEELKRYVFKIAGADLPICSDREIVEGAVILIGGPERNRMTAQILSQEEFDTLVPGPDGMMIKSFGEQTLVLAGSSKNPNEHARATLYAVYELLEHFFGCSFVAYGDLGGNLGEFIPKLSTMTLEQADYCKAKADLPYRTAIIHFDGFVEKVINATPDHKLTISMVDWMAKNRLNRLLMMITTYEEFKKNGILQELIKRGISFTVGHHDSGMFFLPPEGNELFPEKYYETHPEYYRLESDGTRLKPDSKWTNQLIFDMRNLEGIRQIAENIKFWLKSNPYVDVVNFWPNDSDAPQCCCPQCAPHSKTSNYAWMCNEIAKIVHCTYPHVKIDILVYLDLWEPPVGVEFGPGVLVEVATWGPNKIRRFGCNDGSGLIGSEVEANAKAWSRLAGKIVYYDYYMTNYDSKQVYCPMADEIVKIYEDFVSDGYSNGTGSQIDPFNLWNYLFNFYCHGRKSYDISLTFEDILQKFSLIFGKGAKYICEYLRFVENFYDGQASCGNDSARYFAEHVDSAAVYKIFEQAFEAEEEGVLRDNIRMLRMAFRYSDLFTNDPGNEELIYMSQNFGSYWGVLGQSGYGIAIYTRPGKSEFKPNKWYDFSTGKGNKYD